jgi:ABC-2 type transport system ATP-binding protein
MTASDHAIEVQGLAYSFKGHQALHDVSFTVATGTIHGFVGPNGAGKTTTLKVIATLLEDFRGQVQVFGHSVRSVPNAVRRTLGFMPDHLGMYRNMTVFEYLDFFAAAYGQSVRERDKTVAGVLQLTDMDGRRNDLIKGLSRGMEQRVGLARVLVHDPRQLLLDEPASGLDPRARIELMEILRELVRMGKTVFISSHILSELATLCSAVTIIDRGAVRFTGAMRDLLALEGEHQGWRLELQETMPAVTAALTALPGVQKVEAEPESTALLVSIDPAAVDTGRLLRAAMDAGGTVVGFARAQRHLDQAFMDLTEPGVRS